MNNVHKLTEGAILLAVFAILLLITMYVPIIGSVLNLFLALPFIMFAAKNERKALLVFLIASILISLIVGTFLAIPITLSYGLTGIVIGDFIRRKKNRETVFIAGTLVFLLTLVIEYAVAVVFFKVDFIEKAIDLFRQSMEQSQNMLSVLGQEPNTETLKRLNALLDLFPSLVPSLLVIISIAYVLIFLLVSMPIVKRFGVEVNGWKPFRELRLPRSLIFYFLISFLGKMFIDSENGGFLYVALINVLYILLLLMLVQGLSFVGYYSHVQGWSKSIPVIITILMFMMPIILYIVMILGIIDLGFDLRNRLIN